MFGGSNAAKRVLNASLLLLLGSTISGHALLVTAFIAIKESGRWHLSSFTSEEAPAVENRISRRLSMGVTVGSGSS